MPVTLVDDFGSSQWLLIGDHDACRAPNLVDLINVADIVVGVKVLAATCGGLGFIVAVVGRGWKRFGLKIWAHAMPALHQSRHAHVWRCDA
jgi:hypothetical protein